MSEELAQYRVIQNGNPFEDARRLSGDRSIDVVVDVGANVGDVCLHLLANFPEATIHAFEPHRESFRTLERRYASEDRVRAIPLGVSDTSDGEVLRLYSTPGLNSVLQIDADAAPFLEGFGAEALGTQHFDTIRLDEYCAAQGVGTVDFLKLDVQGWELHCLRGAAGLLGQHRIRFLYVEVNFVALYEQQIFYEDVARHLGAFGYRLFSLYALSFNKQGQLCWADALFFRP